MSVSLPCNILFCIFSILWKTIEISAMGWPVNSFSWQGSFGSTALLLDSSCTHTHLRSEFNVQYLDNFTLGENCQNILHDPLDVMKEISPRLNSEFGKAWDHLSWCVAPSLFASLIPLWSSLGSPWGNVASISTILADKVEALNKLGDCLKFLSLDDALIVLVQLLCPPTVVVCPADSS